MILITDALVNQTDLTLQRIAQAESLLLERSERINQQLTPLLNQSTALNEKIEKREKLTTAQEEKTAAKRRQINFIKYKIAQENAKTEELERERQAMQQQIHALQDRVAFLKSPAGIDYRFQKLGN